MAQPAHKIRIGYINATIWKNGDFYNVELSRTYKEGDEYRETSSLGHHDLLNASKVLQRAETWIASQ